jgi:hypothetical protein
MVRILACTYFCQVNGGIERRNDERLHPLSGASRPIWLVWIPRTSDQQREVVNAAVQLLIGFGLLKLRPFAADW